MEAYANIDMEDYWNEYRTISGRRGGYRASHSEDDTRSHEDDIDSSDMFLEVVLPESYREDRELSETELSNTRLYDTLTIRQKEQLIRRAQARNNTLRQKRLKAKSQKPNLWSVFSATDNSSTGTRSRSATPDSLDSISPPRTPPDPSPQNWVEPHLSRSRASLDSGHHSLITSSSAFAPISPPPKSTSPHHLSPHYVPTHAASNASDNKEDGRRYSPPTDKYYYHVLEDDSHRVIYRAPSLDILPRKENEKRSPKKDAALKRQRSYNKDLPHDTKDNNKGFYELIPKFIYDPDAAQDIQGLKYKQIGTLHLPNGKARESFEAHFPIQEPARKNAASLRRTQSIKNPLKDPFDHSNDYHHNVFNEELQSKWDSRIIKENIDGKTRSSSSTDLGFKIIQNEKDPDFPDLYLETSRSGQTKVDWLDHSDIEKLHSLCILEIDIIFSENNIHHSWRKRNRKRKSKDESGVFGVSLETLLEKDKNYLPDPFLEPSIPLVVHKLLGQVELRGIRDEGILRIPGHRAKTEDLKKTLDKHFYSNPDEADSALRRASPNELAALVKLFLRELPQPLLTHTLASAFYKTNKIAKLGERVMALTMLILLLPKSNRDTLRAILDLCGQVVAHLDENKMGLYNVAMIIAPNIFLPTLQPKPKIHILPEDKEQQLSHEMEYAKITTQLVQALIKYRDVLWTVPHRLLAQIRRQYEASLRPSNSKPIHKLLSRKAKEFIQRPIVNEVEYQNGVMRISAPQFNKFNYPVKLDWEMTSRDILMRFIEDQTHQNDNPHRVVGRREQHKSTSISPAQFLPLTTCLLRGSVKHALDNHALHEKGGNIGNRRIDHCACLIAIYQDNPNGEFYIKCHHPGGQQDS